MPFEEARIYARKLNFRNGSEWATFAKSGSLPLNIPLAPSIVYKNVGNAIGAFEKTLITPSRFDEFLKGDYFAIDAREKKGLKTFMEIGCTTCHEGVGIGGHQYQKFGLVEEYKIEDKGRFVVTKDEDDMHVFKVPSLRNVVHTGPYLHDGHIDSLDQVITIMAKHQLGEEVTKEQIADIKAFLGSLTGVLPKF